MIRAILLFSFCIIIFSCSKDSVELNIDYSGSYRGTVIDSVNGEFFTTFDYNSVTLTRNSGSNNYTITNGLIRTSTARIVGSSFTIPQVDAGKYLTYNIIESADGNFNGTGIIRLHVSFYQNWVDPVTNVITKRFVRKCVLTKQ